MVLLLLHCPCSSPPAGSATAAPCPRSEFKERFKLDVKTSPRACYRLRMGCEKLKKILTTNSEAPLK